MADNRYFAVNTLLHRIPVVRGLLQLLDAGHCELLEVRHCVCAQLVACVS